MYICMYLGTHGERTKEKVELDLGPVCYLTTVMLLRADASGGSAAAIRARDIPGARASYAGNRARFTTTAVQASVYAQPHRRNQSSATTRHRARRMIIIIPTDSRDINNIIGNDYRSPSPVRRERRAVGRKKKKSKIATWTLHEVRSTIITHVTRFRRRQTGRANGGFDRAEIFAVFSALLYLHRTAGARVFCSAWRREREKTRTR